MWLRSASAALLLSSGALSRIFNVGAHGHASALSLQKPMPFLFEKLDVYRRALDLADDLARRAADFPRGHRALADQLTRAAISIAANGLTLDRHGGSF
jgi:hypothetical protein